MAEEKKESTSTEAKSGVTLMSAYEAVWKKFMNFNGRLSRKGYWYFVLANMIISFALGLLDRIIFKGESDTSFSFYLKPFTSTYSWIMFIPSIAAATRRLHDKNRTGWVLLLNFFPIVGQIILLVFLLQKGDQAENDYGPVPHE